MAEIEGIGFFDHDGLRFRYVDQSHGLPFVFQHGLGGEIGQPLSLFTPPPGIRLLAFDCRAHGETQPLGDEQKIGLSTFVDDLRAFLDAIGMDRAVIGGTSMGAAMALMFALRYPERTRGLVLSRPAWLEGPTPKPLFIFPLMADLMMKYPPARAKELFRRTSEYQALAEQAPDAAYSVSAQFDLPRARENAIKFKRIPVTRPPFDITELDQLDMPALVLANGMDPIHPLEVGRRLADRLPRAKFVEIVSKSVSREKHVAQVQAALVEFLTGEFADGVVETSRATT